jgi:hypothetical protein
VPPATASRTTTAEPSGRACVVGGGFSGHLLHARIPNSRAHQQQAGGTGGDAVVVMQWWLWGLWQLVLRTLLSPAAEWNTVALTWAAAHAAVCSSNNSCRGSALIAEILLVVSRNSGQSATRSDRVIGMYVCITGRRPTGSCSCGEATSGGLHVHRHNLAAKHLLAWVRLAASMPLVVSR